MYFALLLTVLLSMEHIQSLILSFAITSGHNCAQCAKRYVEGLRFVQCAAQTDKN